MKKILLIVLLISATASAQTVTFADPNFKYSLLQAGYDTSGDGDIQVSEAQAVINLYVSQQPGYSISSLQGIEAFSNVKDLIVTSLHLMTTIDLTVLPSLQSVQFASCQSLQNVNLVNMPAMKAVVVDSCPQLTTMPFTGLSTMEYIRIMGPNNLGDMDITPCTNLNWFRCENLDSLNAAGLTNLTFIDTYSSDTFTALNVTGCTALEVIEAWHSHIENLDVSGLPNLKRLEIQVSNPTLGFPQTTLNASNCPKLELIDAGSGNVAGLVNLSGCTALKEFRGENNSITELDITGCTALVKLSLYNNMLTTIDVSHCTALTNLDLTVNPLESVYMKNGINEHLSYNNFPVTPQFICCDEDDIPGFISMLAPETICNPYCTFEPGGNYNSITGTIRLDMGANGCDLSDPVRPLVKVGYDNGIDQFGTWSNYSGQYLLYAHAGTMTPVAQVENPTFWNISTAAPVTFAAEDSSTQVRDFCMTANGVHPDLEVTIIPVIPAQPGFDANYYINVRNKGNQTLSGNLVFTYNDNVLDLLTTEPASISQTAGSITWSYADLLPFSAASYYVDFNVNSPQETPAVNIDDVLDYTATVSVTNDETPVDNSFTLHQVVVGSFDPNDKYCMQGDIVPTAQIGQYLHYAINFENTGNFPAQNVVIKDMIDADKFDISSLEVFSASHDDVVTITGNRFEIFFENIGLEPNEYGYVAFKIKTKSNLSEGSTVMNKANIYFDFNFPIETNPATTTFQNLGTGDYTAAQSVRIYPNPARDRVNIRCESAMNKISIVDIQGRTIGTYLNAERDKSIDVSGFASGIYTVKISTDKGNAAQKLIIE